MKKETICGIGNKIKIMKDALGDRMKKYYEDRTRISLPRRTYTIIRIDGRCFSQFCRGLIRPFDDGLIYDMDETACYLCKNIQGAKFAFVQSDEISILLTDFDDIATDAWFDGNIQKMTSVAASMATNAFNMARLKRYVTENACPDTSYFPTSLQNGAVFSEILIKGIKFAEFDARVFTIPSKTEVANMIVWRQKDCVRNSISSVAQSLYSHKELENKSSNEQQEMIFQKGINWNDYAPKLKRGRLIIKQEFEIEPDRDKLNSAVAIRSRWVSTECPIFTQDMEFLYNLIPDME
jgi:tRNA(His) 5'-end guanylyltransferase